MRCSRLALTLFSWPEYVLTTYQRNTLVLLLTEEEVLDDALPEQVVGVEEDADDRAGDQHDGRPLDHLVLPGPVDLLQLRPRLADEATTALVVRRDLAGDARVAARLPPGSPACVRLARHELARLPVRRVLPAPAAVLAELDPVRGVPLRLVGLVVAPLALGAGEGDRNSDSALGHCVSR